MVTSPHFEKVRGDVGIAGKCVGVWGRKGRCGKRYERRCRKVRWGVGEVRGDVGKGEGREEMWGSVLGLHTQTHFPTPSPFLSPHANTLPHSPHTLSPHFSTPHLSFLTSPHTPTHFPTHPIHSPTLLHSPHIFPYLPPHPNTLPCTSPHKPLPTAPFTSRYTPTHFPTHLMHLPPNPPQFRVCGEVTPCDDVTLTNLTEKPDKIFYDNREFKVLFRCRQCKFSMYESVAKLPRGKVNVAKLLATLKNPRRHLWQNRPKSYFAINGKIDTTYLDYLREKFFW